MATLRTTDCGTGGEPRANERAVADHLRTIAGSAEAEFYEGYMDGRNPDAPEPSVNRSHCYRHSFAVGMAELTKNPIPAAVSRERAAEAEARDQAA